MNDLITRTPKPNTRESLGHELREQGLVQGDVVIVHSALSKLGWTAGGAVAVVQALMDVLTPEGTLVMPTHTADNTDPAEWQNPPVPESWWHTIRDHMPAFDPHFTPTRAMGAIVECFRTFPGVMRSNHPVTSFAAWGRHAEFVTAEHELVAWLGEPSPLSRIYDLDGKILLLGVGHGNNTSLHLAEHRSVYPGKSNTIFGSAILINGQRQWVQWEALDVNEDDFEQLGSDYEANIGYVPGRVGMADTRLLAQRPLIDFAVEWFAQNRSSA